MQLLWALTVSRAKKACQACDIHALCLSTPDAQQVKLYVTGYHISWSLHFGTALLQASLCYFNLGQCASNANAPMEGSDVYYVVYYALCALCTHYPYSACKQGLSCIQLMPYATCMFKWHGANGTASRVREFKDPTSCVCTTHFSLARHGHPVQAMYACTPSRAGHSHIL